MEQRWWFSQPQYKNKNKKQKQKHDGNVLVQSTTNTTNTQIHKYTNTQIHKYNTMEQWWLSQPQYNKPSQMDSVLGAKGGNGMEWDGNGQDGFPVEFM